MKALTLSAHPFLPRLNLLVYWFSPYSPKRQIWQRTTQPIQPPQPTHLVALNSTRKFSKFSSLALWKWAHLHLQRLYRIKRGKDRGVAHKKRDKKRQRKTLTL